MKLASLIQAARNEHTNSDDRAVSPVIGVILMVAVTVILAAVVGSMALGLGGSLQQIAPNANFQFEYTADGPDNYDVTATHMGGDVITAQETSSLSLIAVGVATPEEFNLSVSSVSAGNSVTLEDVSNNTVVRVVWTSADGGSSQTLASGRTPQ
ncbi:type IV pilin N-terminal domain-containing protein [Halobaculum limi]|uniref:type IV pilin N-terminal domain-containing protein n=1 Tax=Halobaculum limi TaxID=3031916 RepID=UPI002404E525|nr:type IV pilin N-terminal domain-containing protein [Halobaculum sp. YSMS11]